MKKRYLGPDISYVARSRIAETYYLADLWYSGLFSHLSPEQFKSIDKAIGHFIWTPANGILVNSKVTKNPVEKGGLGVPDLPSKLQAMSLVAANNTSNVLTGLGLEPVLVSGVAIFDFFAPQISKVDNFNLPI